MNKVFRNDQIEYLVNGKVKIWTPETIIKALKLRFALGVHGYNYLRNCDHYAIPAYSTLCEKVRSFKLNYGIFEEVLQLIQHKAATMNPVDKYCMISIDEMQISKENDYNKHMKQFLGYITLGTGEKEELGSHLLVVLLRGIYSNWKQLIAAHITGTSLNKNVFKQFIEKCITSVETSGLRVIALSSDMGAANKGLWNAFNVGIKKGFRQNKFVCNGHDIFVLPDVCHLLKNFKNTVLKYNSGFELPKEYVDLENLCSTTVSGEHIKKLWDAEVGAKKEIRTLHHIQLKDIRPDNFQKMHVGSAIRFFSSNTAAAIENGIDLKILPSAALSTANFIRVIEEWFELCNSKLRKRSVTLRNKEKKFELLQKVINIFHGITIADSWKPANTGFILASLSLMEISEFLLSNGFDFVLLHRFTQDALENIFSQIRRKAGSMPGANDSMQALRMITLSQFLSDVKSTNYSNDDDVFLLDFISTIKKTEPNIRNSDSAPKIPTTGDWSLPTSKFCTVSTLEAEESKLLNLFDIRNCFNLSGSTVASIQKHCCATCNSFLLSQTNSPVPEKYQKYVEFLNKGGLKKPCGSTLQLIINCEILFRKYKYFILHTGLSELAEKIIKDIEIQFPLCCNVKSKIVSHFFTVRGFATQNFSKCLKRKAVYGTASCKTKKV